MKVIKITASWCSACIIMNEIWNKLNKNYNIETLELDIDFDENEVKKYNIGSILPVFIFCDDKKQEIFRICGEHSFNELEKIILEYR